MRSLRLPLAVGALGLAVTGTPNDAYATSAADTADPATHLRHPQCCPSAVTGVKVRAIALP